ncbi:MAG: chromosome segregation protein [Planctomycetota bacterium]|jgi:chromosome segregation protein
MRLRRLEAYGFKSFADRVSLDFGDGVTAIIGPNGCGKSNVVDAIKWVMGEQSAKSLRGEEMTDVIFNGCATRRAMAFCEVTLVMDQVVGLGIEAEEVAITRRLFRDGSSHYYLGGKACRLRDIKDLFLGTGAGTTADSVIEQGRVGFILESNTKERRIILEEAAGISKYRARRRLAARKLERVEQDLQRIAEVLAEVRKRSRSVQRQAAAALRWKELDAQVKELRLAFILDEWARLADEHAANRDARIEADARTIALTSRSAALEADIASRDTALVALEQALAEVEEARTGAVARRDVARARSQDLRKRLTDLDSQEDEDRRELATAGARLSRLAQELATARGELALAEAEGGGDTTVLDAPRAEVAAAQLALDAAAQALDDLRRQREACARELARVSTERGRIQGALQGVRDRRNRIEERSGGAGGGLAEALNAEAEARGEWESALQAAAGAHAELDERAKARAEADAALREAEQAVAEARADHARLEARHRVLAEQDRRAEGVARGPREVLQAMGGRAGILGLVADLFRVADDHVVAIETALGGAASHVVTERADDAKDAIDFLKREGKGRATFLPLDDLRGGGRIDRDLLREPGVVGPATDLVEHETRFQPVFDFLLGPVLVVETLDHAIALRRRRRVDCRIVTLDGEVVVAGGAMTGGKDRGHDHGGLVSRKQELARAEEELKAVADAGQTALARREACRRGLAQANEATERVRAAIQACDRAAADARSRLVAAEKDRQHLEQTTAGFGAELEETARDQARLEQEDRELAGQDEWFQAMDRRLVADLAARQQAVDDAVAARDRAQESLNLIRVSRAAGAERLEAARQRTAAAERALREAEEDQERRVRRLEQQAGVRAAVLEQLAENDAEAVRAAGEAETIIAGAKDRLRERDDARHALEELRQEAKAAAAKLRHAEQDKNALQIKQAEIEARQEALRERTLAEFQRDVAEVAQVWQRPDDREWSGAKARLGKLEKELADLGPVNLAALDELEEAQAREQFLAKGHDDLVAARDKLAEVIDGIDDTCRRLFDDTYRQVRANFQGLFRKLFGGGSADLKLERWETVIEQTNPEEPPREVRREVDVLEAGLEIVAQPPGKNPKIITQLSGGEKALTAIALLFAVYQTRPSPFCILDEVDAPLDDANVDVYNSVVREFVRGHADGSTADGSHKGSQFIVITHKKRTMQRADAIYGVTQNERGVSTKISVKIEDVETHGELVTTVRGAGPFAG